MWLNGEARETLYRIAVLLLSLAGLAEQAASVSPARRRSALSILRTGEFAALGALVDLSAQPLETLSFEAYWDAVESDDPEDALLLAARLRFLGLAIAHAALLAANARTGNRWRTPVDSTRTVELTLHYAMTGDISPPSLQRAYIDTS